MAFTADLAYATGEIVSIQLFVLLSEVGEAKLNISMGRPHLMTIGPACQ